MTSRLLYDARETDAKTLEVIEPLMDWSLLEKAAEVREHIKNLHKRDQERTENE